MFKRILMLLTISLNDCCLAIENKTIDDLNLKSVTSIFERKTRANLVSFEPLGQHIQLGLDFLLPFLKVPIVRKVDAYGNEPALVNINTAALVTTGLLATSSALISLIFRRYVVPEDEESSTEKRRRSDNNLEHELWSILNNFKLTYTNSSGARVDTSLASLFDTINETFQKSDIDLSSCIKKAICMRIQQSARRVSRGDSSGVDKIIDGLVGIKWLRHFLRHTSLRDALDSKNVLSLSDQQNSKIYCDIKYPQCKWSLPEDYLIDIVNTYLKFT